MNRLKLNNVSKSYNKTQILSDISYEFESGKIYGIFGENASGKTTLLKCIAGLEKLNRGSILLNESTVKTKDISFMSDVPKFFRSMNLKRLLEFYRDMYKDFNIVLFYDYISISNLDKKAKLSVLSKGQLELIFICLTLSRESSVYILDEPFVALDISLQEKLLQKLIKNLDENAILIMSTHYPATFEYLFDTVLFLANHQIICEDNMENIMMKNGSLVNKYKEVIYNV